MKQSIPIAYQGEVQFDRSGSSSRDAHWMKLRLTDLDAYTQVQGFDGKRFQIVMVEIGNDEQPVQSKPQPETKKASTLAFEICRNPEFWEFADSQLGYYCDSEDMAAEAIKLHVGGILHRTDLDKFSEAGAKFMREIYQPFQAWKAGR
jgi:hypothetical protein